MRVRLAIHVFDATTIALAFLLVAMLRRKWLVLPASAVFAVFWYLFTWHSAWLGSVPAVIVDCSTFGLAFLGGHVALSPPSAEQVALKRFYVASFVALAILGIVANLWQRNVEAGKQAILQEDETAARIQFSQNLTDVKVSNQAILNFVAHPPKGLTQEQVVSVVRTFLAKPQGTSITSLSGTDLLKVMAPQVLTEMQYWAGKWDDDDRKLELQGLGGSDADHAYFLLKRTEQNNIDTKQILPTLENAEYLREQLRPFPSYKQNQEDKEVAATLSKALAGQAITWKEMRQATRYIEGLIKQAGLVSPQP